MDFRFHSFENALPKSGHLGLHFLRVTLDYFTLKRRQLRPFILKLLAFLHH